MANTVDKCLSRADSHWLALKQDLSSIQSNRVSNNIHPRFHETINYPYALEVLADYCEKTLHNYCKYSLRAPWRTQEVNELQVVALDSQVEPGIGYLDLHAATPTATTWIWFVVGFAWTDWTSRIRASFFEWKSPSAFLEHFNFSGELLEKAKFVIDTELQRFSTTSITRFTVTSKSIKWRRLLSTWHRQSESDPSLQNASATIQIVPLHYPCPSPITHYYLMKGG